MAPDLNRVILVAPAGMGGIQVLCGKLAREFGRRGIEATVLFEDIRGEGDSCATARGQCSAKSENPLFEGVKYQTFQYDLLDNHVRICRQMQDILLEGGGVAYPNTSGMAYRAIASLGPRRPVTIAGCLSDFEHDYETISRFAPFWDHAFANSSLIAGRLRQRLPASAPPVEVIPPGVESPEILPVRSSQPGSIFHIVFCGRLSAVKRIPDVLAAASALRERNIEVRMTLIGDGEDRLKVEQRIREDQLENHVEITGILPPADALKRMEAAHVLLLLSEREGFGLCILEGMSQGVVPIITQTCGARDVICPGENGFLVEVGDVSRVADILADLSSDRSRLEAISRRAHEICRREYCPDKEIARHIEMIRAAARHHQAAAHLAPPARNLFSRLDQPWIPNRAARLLRRLRLRHPHASS